MKQTQLILKNDITEIGKIHLFLTKLSAEWNLSKELIFELNLVLEECIVNIIRYGYTDNKTHEIKIELRRNDKTVSMLIEDDGVAFNILEEPPTGEHCKPIEKRKIGGLGIHFVKSLVDHINYKREDELNKLILIKNLKTETYE